MSTDKEPSGAGLAGHFTHCVSTAVASRNVLPAGASKGAKDALDNLIVSLCNAAISHVERDKASRGQ